MESLASRRSDPAIEATSHRARGVERGAARDARERARSACHGVLEGGCELRDIDGRAYTRPGNDVRRCIQGNAAPPGAPAPAVVGSHPSAVAPRYTRAARARPADTPRREGGLKYGPHEYGPGAQLRDGHHARARSAGRGVW